MSKKLLLACGVSTAALLAGCSTPQPQVEPQPYTDNHKERCYSMNKAPEVRVGQAKIEEGQQFYFGTECNQNLSLEDEEMPEYLEQEASDSEDSDSVDLDTDNKEEDKTESSESDGAGDNAEDKSKEVDVKYGEDWFKNPTCYYSKTTAANEDLEPCGEDFYQANPHLR